jgi:hypothetical protein
MEDVEHLYGSAEIADTRHQDFTYLNGAIEVRLSSGTVAAIELRNGFALVGGAGVHEPLATYLGKPASALLEDFGLPHRMGAGTFEYRFSAPGRTGEVDFECDTFRECVCTAITVRWRVP